MHSGNKGFTLLSVIQYIWGACFLYFIFRAWAINVVLKTSPKAPTFIISIFLSNFLIIVMRSMKFVIRIAEIIMLIKDIIYITLKQGLWSVENVQWIEWSLKKR